MAKVKQDAAAQQAEREYIEDHIDVLYEVGLSVQVSVNGRVPGMTADERRSALLAAALEWLSSTGGFELRDPDGAAKRILEASEEVYDGEEMVDFSITG